MAVVRVEVNEHVAAGYFRGRLNIISCHYTSSANLASKVQGEFNNPLKAFHF